MPRPADPNARASLVSAARAEFVKKGLRGARIEDITAACGLSKGAFYLHFASKEALFGELVEQVQRTLDELAREREERKESFFTAQAHLAAQRGAPVDESAPFHQRLALFEADLRALEVMWEYRDVMHVLQRGSQGTEFESLFSVLVDREVERVATDFRQMQDANACRPEISPTLFGTVIVGTYALLIQQMIRMREKPDLATWARDLQLILREGGIGRVPVPVRMPRAAASLSSSRSGPARAATRRTSRKP